MGILHWRVKNVLLLLIVTSAALVIYKLKSVFPTEAVIELIYGEDPKSPCNKYVTPLGDNMSKKWPVIGILGPPGSGVVWQRFLIEQMTGIHTGSTSSQQHEHIFKANGQRSKVVAIMAHDISELPSMAAGVVVFREMKETVRSQFAAKHGPGALLEAPMDAYYGKDWEEFSFNEAKLWAQRYRGYIKSGKPILIVTYDEITDSTQVKKVLLSISHFLRVPVRHRVLDCLVDRIGFSDLHSELKPRPLRYGFHPFELLSPNKLELLEKFDNFTANLVMKSKEAFVPKVHV